MSYKFLMGMTIVILVFRGYCGELIRYLIGLTMYGNFYLASPEYDVNLKLGMQIIVAITILACGLLFKPQNDVRYNFFMKCEFIALYVMMLSDYIPVCDRLFIYYHMYTIFLVPLVAKNIIDLFTRKAYIWCVVLAYIGLFTKQWLMAMEMQLGSPLVTPYISFLGCGD